MYYNGSVQFRRISDSSAMMNVFKSEPFRVVVHWLPYVIIVLTLLLILVAAYGYFGQSNASSKKVSRRSIDELLLFFPSKYPDGDWQPENLRFEDVWMTAEDGTRIHGWYCPCENPRGTILIAHGNAGNLAWRAPWLTILQQKLQVSTLMFDYRGYGRSAGKPSVPGALQDARAARKKLAEIAGIHESEIILMGESLGGAVVVQLAAESPARGLILQSTFSSLRDVADVHYPGLSWVVPPTKLNSSSQIRQYRGPLLQSHGNADRIIPFSSGQLLFQAANEPKKFVTLEGADHNDWLTEDYLQRLEDFLQRVGSAKRDSPQSESP